MRQLLNWPPHRRPWIWALFGGLSFLFLVFVSWLIFIEHGCDWTGVGNCTPGASRPGKTLWDLLQLLIVPLLIGAVAIYFNWRQKQTELIIAAQRAATDQAIALDNQRDAILREYFDRMDALLLDRRLRDSEDGDEVRAVAQIRTFAVFRSLDPIRKGILIEFLHEAALIGGPTRVNKPDSSIINLFGANFSGANLVDVVLEWDDLRGIDLTKACLLKAILTGANLTGANLTGANLTDTTLDEVNLEGANLTGVNLTGAILEGANLWYANLNGATVTQEQLDSCASLRDAIMPDGSKHP